MNACVITEPGKVAMNSFDENQLIDDIEVFLGGWMGIHHYLGADMVAVVYNDDGIRLSLPHTCNIKFNNRVDELLGPVAIFKIKGRDFSSITLEEATEFIGKYIF